MIVMRYLQALSPTIPFSIHLVLPHPRSPLANLHYHSRLVAAPLLHRHSQAVLPLPRRVRPHRHRLPLTVVRLLITVALCLFIAIAISRAVAIFVDAAIFDTFSLGHFFLWRSVILRGWNILAFLRVVEMCALYKSSSSVKVLQNVD